MDGYERVIDAFPTAHFVMQSIKDPKHDFKPKLNDLVFGSPSEYILFAVDDIIVKDFVDLGYCMEQMEKTGAYGFILGWAGISTIATNSILLRTHRKATLYPAGSMPGTFTQVNMIGALPTL